MSSVESQSTPPLVMAPRGPTRIGAVPALVVALSGGLLRALAAQVSPGLIAPGAAVRVHRADEFSVGAITKSDTWVDVPLASLRSHISREAGGSAAPNHVDLYPGDHLQVELDGERGGRRRATFAGLSGDTIFYIGTGRTASDTGRVASSRVWAARSSRRRGSAGMVVGAGIGAAATFAYVVANPRGRSRITAVAESAPVGAVLGAVVGSITGAFMSTDVWSPVQMRR
jgi:hypothetical protein